MLSISLSQFVGTEPRQLAPLEVAGSAISPPWRNGLGISLRGKYPNSLVEVSKASTPAIDLLFQSMNVGADLSALCSQGGDNVSFGHGPNLGLFSFLSSSRQR